MGCAGLWLLFAGCQERPAPAEGRKLPVFCYRQFERSAPGVWRLGQPIDCNASARRYRAQGRRDRPTTVELIDADGQKRMVVRIGRRADGRPAWEERAFRQRPENVQLELSGKRIEFRPQAGHQWQWVRVRTEIDDRGRPVREEKYVGDRLAFRVERTWGPQGLEREATFDGDGRLRLERTFRLEDGKRIETMKDADGRVLLKREAADPAHPDSG